MILRIQSQYLLILHFSVIMNKLFAILNSQKILVGVIPGKFDEELYDYLDLDIFVLPSYYIFWLNASRFFILG